MDGDESDGDPDDPSKPSAGDGDEATPMAVDGEVEPMDGEEDAGETKPTDERDDADEPESTDEGAAESEDGQLPSEDHAPDEPDEGAVDDGAEDDVARDEDGLIDIGHDEYNPIGTLALLLVYALILVVLWIYTYFVEFLGRDLTVVGTVVPIPGVTG